MGKKKIKLAPAAFVGPHLILFIIFILIPTVYGFYISFTQWNLINEPTFVGLQNYKTILFDTDSTYHFQFMNGMKNTLIYVVITVPFIIILPLLLAVTIEHKKVKYKGFWQAVLYVPSLLSVSAAALIWSLIFNKQLGMVNNMFGSEAVWRNEMPYAWITIMALVIWCGIGGNLVIYRSAISGVSEELYESASLDGAGPVRKFISITLPSIRFPLFYTFVMGTAGAFSVFAQPLMMTEGNPQEGTHVLMMYIRSLAFGDGESIAGMAGAMAILLGIIIFMISAMQYAKMNQD